MHTIHESVSSYHLSVVPTSAHRILRTPFGSSWRASSRTTLYRMRRWWSIPLFSAQYGPLDRHWELETMELTIGRPFLIGEKHSTITVCIQVTLAEQETCMNSANAWPPQMTNAMAWVCRRAGGGGSSTKRSSCHPETRSSTISCPSRMGSAVLSRGRNTRSSK